MAEPSNLGKSIPVIQPSDTSVTAEQERELRKLRNLFLGAPVGIGLVANRCLLDVNRRMCQMIGYTREELIGHNARVLYPTDQDYNYVGVEKYRQIDETGTGTVETRWQRKDGEIINILLSSTLLDSADHAAGVTFTALDITERQRAAVEREQLESQLRQARKMEAMGQLASGIAHDFNNVLTAILGSLEMVRSDLRGRLSADDVIYNHVRQAEDAGLRAAQLTRQLLAFGRKQHIKPDLINLDLLVGNMTQLLPSLIRADIRLDVTCADDIPPIRADAGQLEQVIINLVVNARDAMPQGGKLVVHVSRADISAAQVARYPEASPGPHAILTVSDPGTGIAPEALEHIFEPFFSTKLGDTGTGAGLGLATVHSIVKRCGGHIEVDTAPGQGSTFRVCLPACDNTATPTAE